MLVGEVASGAAIAGLHLVHHQQPLMFVTEGAQLVQVVRGGNVDTAFTLYRLHQNGNDIGVFLGHLADGFHIVVGHAHKTADQGLITGLDGPVAGGTQGCKGAAMEGVFHDDDGGQVDPLLMTVAACQLDGRLVGFGTGIAKEHVVHAGKLNQLFAQEGLLRNGIDVGAMEQTLRLFADRTGNGGVGVAQPGDGDAAQSVQVTIAVCVVDPHPFAALKGNGHPVVGIHQWR